MKACNILWDVDVNDGLCVLHEMTYKRAAAALGISPERYVNMTDSEKDDYAESVLYRYGRVTSDLRELLGLPNEVEIPENVDVSKDDRYMESVADWLSDTYGYCVGGFEVR